MGIYYCIEVFGEFVWRSGILIRVVIEGCWALLEDIDYVLMDVVFIFLFFLERGVLLILGYGENVIVYLDFRFFVI